MDISVIQGELSEPEKNHLRHILYAKAKFKKFGPKNYFLDPESEGERCKVTIIHSNSKEKKQSLIASDHYDLSYLNNNN